jgi:hypothetical protein
MKFLFCVFSPWPKPIRQMYKTGRSTCLPDGRKSLAQNFFFFSFLALSLSS